MTWREFQLRLIGYKRSVIEKWYHTRLLGYQIYLNTQIKGKHVSIDKYMPIEDDIKKATTNQHREILMEAQREAIAEAKQKSLSNAR